MRLSFFGGLTTFPDRVTRVDASRACNVSRSEFKLGGSSAQAAATVELTGIR